MSAAVLELPPAAPGATACAHCAAAIAGDARFCCTGCEGAHALVRGLGLEDFYRRRIAAAGAQRPAAERRDVSAWAQESGEGAWRIALDVDGLTCGACVWLIETALAREPAVTRARVNLSARRLAIEWRGARAEADRLAALVARLGFRVAPCDPAVAEDAQARHERELLRGLAVAGFAAANVMLLSVSVWSGHDGSMGPAARETMHWLSALIALPAIAYAGRPFFRSALGALAAGRTNMDVPISIGVAVAAAMSLYETASGRPHAFFDSAVTLLFFLLAGRYLDQRARGRARAAARQLAGLAARAASVVDADGSVRVVRPEAVQPGQIVLAAGGERIAVDGVVIEGRSSVDQSLVTGESVPVAVGPGAAVFAGTLVVGSGLRVRAAKAGEGTLLAEIARLVEAAEGGRSRYRALADRVARFYAPVVHVGALATFLGWALIAEVGWERALMNAVAVLIITCPCALALAVPVVQVVAAGRLQRRGILLRSATALERLAEADVAVLDKTGTLTLGRPELIGPVDADALRLAAGIAQASRHPLARALVRADPEAPTPPGVVEHAGRGLSLAAVSGQIRLGARAWCADAADTTGDASLELWLARPGARPLRFAFADRPRPDAREAVAALAARGLAVELLSGDRPDATRAAAAAAGIATWHAAADPAAKAARLSALAAAGHRPAMIGDGLNDAPALAAAHVSLSPAAGSDLARNAADFVFQGERLGAVVEAIDVARGARLLARQNLLLALGYNALAVPLAIAGLVTPLIAAVAMSSSSVLVVANALRLGRMREQADG